MHMFFTGAGQRLRSFFYWFGMYFGTIPIYVRIHADSVRVRPPLPAVEELLHLCSSFFVLVVFTCNVIEYTEGTTF